MGGHDHLVPRADAQGLEDQHQGVEAVGHANGAADAAIGGEFRFKGLDFGAQDIPA